ncbi:MAG: type II toxin-antitoxin system RelE/ParE family toxin [Eubacteriaceae bacterium]|nr:type II toxin-antitoxin system RelE/ParE family toxin [Eubacteriaceae bacterium]
MAWAIEYFKEAQKDLAKIDHSQKLQVLKAIEKVSQNPLPDYEGGYGKPLSNNDTTKLAGYYKIKLLKLGIRIVYGLVKEDERMKIVVISVREDEAVYKLADKRIK